MSHPDDLGLAYYRRLAAELRARQLSERNVRSALADVRRRCELIGIEPTELVGIPQDYAAGFCKGMLPRWSGLVGAGATGVVTNETFHRTADLTAGSLGPVTWPWIAASLIVMVSVALAELLRRRLPRGFRRGVAS